MNTTAKDNRARLLNMAAGGDGHTEVWAERVTYDGAPADAQGDGYMVHIPQRAQGGKVIRGFDLPMQTAKAARACVRVMQTGAVPRSPETTAEQAQAECDAVPIEDHGRHVPYPYKK